MNAKSLWLLIGVLAVTVIGWGAALAQRGDSYGGPPLAQQPGRYTVVSVAPHGITLLDTATGDLFLAGPNDVKPYSQRGRVGGLDFPYRTMAASTRLATPTGGFGRPPILNTTVKGRFPPLTSGVASPATTAPTGARRPR